MFNASYLHFQAPRTFSTKQPELSLRPVDHLGVSLHTRALDDRLAELYGQEYPSASDELPWPPVA